MCVCFTLTQMYAKMCERTHNALISQKYNHQIYKAVAISNINIKLWNLVHDALSLDLCINVSILIQSILFDKSNCMY